MTDLFSKGDFSNSYNLLDGLPPNGDKLYAKHINELRNVARFGHSLTTGRTKMERGENVSYTAGQTLTMANLTGSGCVTLMWITLVGANLFKDSVLKIYVDGELTPSIETDLGALGTSWLDVDGKFSTENMHVESNTSNCASYTTKFKIPYSTSIKIDIYNPTVQSGNAYWQIFYTEDFSPPFRLKSQAVSWLNKVTVPALGSYTFIDLPLDGWLVWHSMVMHGATTDRFMESDINFYIDGEETPSISTTGTEDYFLSAWYYSNAVFSSPMVFCSVIDPVQHVMTAGLDLLAAFGGIRFTSHLKMILDCSESNTNFDMSHCMLYYVNI